MTEKRKSGKNSLRLRLISSVMLNLLDISAPPHKKNSELYISTATKIKNFLSGFFILVVQWLK